MNSFIQNVNYIASLDNNYGDQVCLLKNNLTLMNTANDIVLSFKYFDFNERTTKEINHSKTGVLYSGLEPALQEFVDKINTEMGIKVTATYQLLNLTIGFSIAIASNVSDIKVNELNFNAKKTQDQVELYNLYGNVRNTLKILPTLAMLDKSVLDGFAIAGKNIGDIITVSDNIDDVITVSDNIESVNIASQNIVDIETVSDNIANVNNVGSNIDSVNTIVTDIENVNIVAENIDDVNSVSINIESVKPVALNIDAIVNVDNNISNIETNADNIVNINKVADNIENINLTGTSIDNINIVAPKIDKVETVANNITNVNNVADNSTNINTVSTNITDVNKVATNKSNINVVSTNIDKVNTVADNIVDIQNAEENAQIAIDKAAKALASEEKAQKWADYPEDQIVQGTFGIDDKYSAYHWAKKAEAAIGGNIKVDSLYDVDTTGILDKGILSYDSSDSIWKPYDFAKNDVIGFDTSAGTIVAEGQMAWNSTEGTLDLGLQNGVTLQVGQENVRIVRNGTGSTILNGTVVMAVGTIGNSGRILIQPFTGLFNEAHLCYGIATQDILPGTDGIITIEGKVMDINTTGSTVGELWEDGDILYAKPNDAGNLTKVMPADNELKMIMARVIKSHTAGTLEIRFTPINENIYYTKVQSDNIFNTKVNKNDNIIAGTGTKITYDEKGLVTGSTSLVDSDIPNIDANKITSGIIDSARLPAYVDDVIEFNSLSNFPLSGETGKIYVAIDTNKTYRWSGTTYIYITSGAVDSVNGYTGVITLTKSDVGLSNADNTSDINKPISAATQTALNLKADKAGKLNQFASTTSSELAVVISDETGTGSLVFANSPMLVTPNIGIASGTSFNSITGLSSTSPLVDGTVDVGTSTSVARADHRHPTDTSRAPLDSPALTGTPSAPTAAVGNNTTRLATTEFVNAEIANDTYSKTQLDAGQLDNRYYTEAETNLLLDAKVDDTEIASVNLLRADKYLAAQNVVSMSYNLNRKLEKVQYNNATDVDYEVLTYNADGKLNNVAHYVGGVLKGNTILSYVNGKLVSAPFTAV